MVDVMTKLIKLDKDSQVKVTGKALEYLAPDYVYIPLPKRKEDLKKETNIKMASVLYNDVYAPVSGKLVKLETCSLPSGKKVKCLGILNDFQEKSEKTLATRKKINNLTFKEIIDSIYSTKIKEKFQKEFLSTFLISGIDDEPYIENEVFLQRTQTKPIIDILDALLNLYPNSKAYIALKNTDSETILAYQNLIGMYSNIEIKLVNDLFLIGKEPFLTKYLHLKNNYIYFKASELFEMYINVKKRKPLLEKYITVSGNGVQNPFIVKTKIGVKVMDIFEKFWTESPKDCVLYVNGIMQGKDISVEDMIVTKDLDGFVVVKREKKEIKKCMKCGKCISICPIHSNPLMAYKLGIPVKCIHCGLCSYICPSYIPLQKYLSGEENE